MTKQTLLQRADGTLHTPGSYVAIMVETFEKQGLRTEIVDGQRRIVGEEDFGKFLNSLIDLFASWEIDPDLGQKLFDEAKRYHPVGVDPDKYRFKFVPVPKLAKNLIERFLNRRKS